MCTGAELALIMTAAGTGAQTINNQRALRRQDQRLAEGLREQGRLQREANQRVMQQADELAASTGEAERAEALAGFQEALRRSDESATEAVGGQAPLTAANPRFAERVSQGQLQVRGEAADRAGRLARIDAPRFQRMNEGASLNDAVTALSEIGRRSDAADFIARLRAAEERPNQFIDVLGSVLQGAGTGLAMGGSLPFFNKAPNLAKLAKAGTIIDPTGTTTGGGANPFVAALRRNA